METWIDDKINQAYSLVENPSDRKEYFIALHRQFIPVSYIRSEVYVQYEAIGWEGAQNGVVLLRPFDQQVMMERDHIFTIGADFCGEWSFIPSCLNDRGQVFSWNLHEGGTLVLGPEFMLAPYVEKYPGQIFYIEELSVQQKKQLGLGSKIL